MIRYLILAFFLTTPAWAAPHDPIELWPAGKVPGEESLKLPPETTEPRTSNVSVPTLTFYPAPARSNTGTTIVVAPGGGYKHLAYEHEGSDVCNFLNSIGVNAVLLKYRVPHRKGLEKHHAPLQDAQRAISMVRNRAEEWTIKPDQVGILGFSAGGHLAVMAMTSDGSRSYKTDPVIDATSCVPDFAVPIYPAYLQDPANPNALSPEIKITEETPPAFITIAHGDKRFVEGAALLYLEMFRRNRQCELHIYGHGGHGFGMREIPEKVGEWPERLTDWLGAMGYLGE
ncbi:alpha/beta hydrolase [Verrucomicrobiales bacterium BCK34]|nr:alpha/beta hydrolase [Verrucomicrobiales bacterium BCK34]